MQYYPYHLKPKKTLTARVQQESERAVMKVEEEWLSSKIESPPKSQKYF